VKRFSRFHCDWPWRSSTSVGIRTYLQLQREP
jgi:hypothetical protein